MVATVSRTLRCLPLLLAWLAFPLRTFAHRLDEYLQATLVEIEPGDLRLLINLTPGTAVAEQVISAIDRDHDGLVSAGEGTAYAELLKRDLVVRLDGRKITLKLAASHFPAPIDLRTGMAFIEMEFTAIPGSMSAGTHHLGIENKHLTPISVYLLNASQPKSKAIQVTSQRRNENQSVGEIQFAYHSVAKSRRELAIFAIGAALLIAISLRCGGSKALRQARTAFVR
jgi:hypothetical protein